MKILMTLSNPFTHDPRVYNEAQSLVKEGYDVTVLGWDRKKENMPREIKDGINIIRSYNTKFMDLIPYDILKLHLWWNKGYKDAIKLYKETPFDVVHCHDLSSLPIGIKLKKKLDLPLIYDAHEIWGYMVVKDFTKLWASYYLRKEKSIIKHVDKIITVNQPLKDYFSEISNKEITIIMNCKNLREKKNTIQKNEKFTLLYIGALRKTRFLLELIDTVKEIPDVHLIIGGIGKPEFMKEIEDKCSKAKNIDFIGKVPMKEVLPMTMKSDVVVCMFDPNDYVKIGLPNKLFESMVCGRPIIVTKGTYSGEFVEKENIGLSIPYTKEDLKDAIIKLRDNPKLWEELGKNGLKAAIREYNWEKQEEKLVGIYENICR